MKISNSKKQLAKIISENGGWPCDAEYSSQDGSDGQVSFYKCGTPIYNKLAKIWNAPGSCVHMYGSRIEGLGRVGVIKNFHKTILSRDEYFHLYPAPDADGWIEWKGGECPVERGTLIDVRHRNKEEYIGVPALGRWNYAWFRSGINPDDIIAYRPHKPEQSKSTAVGDDETNLAAKEELEALEFEPIKPTIEQLAADYRAKLAIAQQAQEEADSHRCGAEAALEKLVAAGKALGLVLSVAAPEPEPELVITDWRDLKVGDEVEITESYSGERVGTVGVITRFSDLDERFRVRVHFDGNESDYEWISGWRFIRRP